MFVPRKLSHELSFCAVLFYCCYVNAQKALPQVKCESFGECSTCLQQVGCFWCLHPEQNRSSPGRSESVLNHCIPDKSTKIICSPENAMKPKTGSKIVVDMSLQNEGGNVVQLQPQKIILNSRKGESFDINFQYSQAKNYPVDLYYIIDNSHSMLSYKNQLATLGNELIEAMRNLTSDFRIGFGSFIDKVVLPYARTLPGDLKNPCVRENKICITPYSFKNHLALTSDSRLFVSQVRNLQVSGNLDGPEGGFDAIIQAILCKEDIGWRPHARHLIVFSTDAKFHIAGDGKLGGIIETNSAVCQMKNGLYDGLNTDYPSISHLNYIAKENNINLIFAVVKSKTEVLNSYELLSKQIENSKANGLDSGNIIDLVVDNYKRIVNTVRMENNATKNIEVKIIPHCENATIDGCSNLHNGDVVDFTAKIKLLECPADLDKPTIISIKPDVINESLIIELNSICKCDCESPQHRSYGAKSSKCQGYGDLVCGICLCNRDRSGSQCECDKNISDNSEENGQKNNDCRENKPGAEVCSGLGLCNCGKCECRINPNTGRKYSGKYCDCDDDSCERENGILCGGRGICSCGRCSCDAGWTGNSCGCSDSKRGCFKEGDMNACSGNGNCSCGKCECNAKYTGSYCEVCPTCSDKCSDIKDCVECKVFRSGLYDQNECKLNCDGYNITTVDEVFVDEENDDRRCLDMDSKKCEIFYKYNFVDLSNLVVTVRKEKFCEPDHLVWVLGLIGAILLFGILTLILWKVFTMIHDKREYAKFMNEQKNSRWHTNDNPLYKDAVTTFRNPYYPN